MAAGDGLISMKPTSIAYSGTSASINADGGVDFTAVTSLSLNGVFTGDYDNYLMVVTHEFSAATVLVRCRLRAAGSSASGTDYTYQRFFAGAGSIIALRVASATEATIGRSDDDGLMSGDHVHIYGPALAQPTAFRSVNVSGDGAASLEDFASTHSLSTAYDGIELFPAAGNMTGTVHVFGYEE